MSRAAWYGVLVNFVIIIPGSMQGQHIPAFLFTGRVSGCSC
jgi:hypothetical protein